MNATKSQRRGVSHTPENIHVDKRVHSGVCDTPLQVISPTSNLVECGHSLKNI